jgi:hypothetical protein
MVEQIDFVYPPYLDVLIVVSFVAAFKGDIAARVTGEGTPSVVALGVKGLRSAHLFAKL